MNESPRVLSVQSHVVSGYVGNKSAVFPLQLLGFEVDSINSVQFSNHMGYKKVTGQILTEQDIEELIQGLSANGIDYYTHILTGYIGSVSILNKISTIVKQLRKINPNLIYICDPVMGDHGRLYVTEALLPVYKNDIIPLATIITPNLFEAELLTDVKIANVNDVWKAIDLLHEKGCKTVVISSAELDESSLNIFGSNMKSNAKEKLSMNIRKLPANFGGCGDLFAALFLSWMYKSNGNFKDSLEKTVASLQAVLKRTFNYAEDKELNRRNLELKLIQSKRDIEEPQIIYYATIVE